MPTIFSILKFMSMTSFMNVLRLILFHECFKIDLVAYAINNMSRLKNILQAFKLYNYMKVLS